MYKDELVACIYYSTVDMGYEVCSYGGKGIPLGSVAGGSSKFFISWLSHLLVDASSFRHVANVPSFSWSGKHCRRASLALFKRQKRS